MKIPRFTVLLIGVYSALATFFFGVVFTNTPHVTPVQYVGVDVPVSPSVAPAPEVNAAPTPTPVYVFPNIIEELDSAPQLGDEIDDARMNELQSAVDEEVSMLARRFAAK